MKFKSIVPSLDCMRYLEMAEYNFRVKNTEQFRFFMSLVFDSLLCHFMLRNSEKFDSEDADHYFRENNEIVINKIFLLMGDALNKEEVQFIRDIRKDFEGTKCYTKKDYEESLSIIDKLINLP